MRYSFGVRKKGSNEYIKLGIKHSLAFLDYFALHFNNKEELMHFLNIDLASYDDIAITYNSNGENKVLPIYFDALELYFISSTLISLKSLEDFDDYQALAIAYQNPSLITTETFLPRSYVSTIINGLIDNNIEKALKEDVIHERIYKFYENNGNFELELLKSYLCIRKIYDWLRRIGALYDSMFKTEPVLETMDEILASFSVGNNSTMRFYQILSLLSPTEYEEFLISKAVSSEEAYEELMALSSDRLERLAPIIKHINTIR